ncbi:GyrI-like small molecule binding domain 10 [Candidatus Hepatincola sp. Av]
MDKVTIHGIVATEKMHFIGIVKFQDMIEKFNNIINENYKELEQLVNNKDLVIKQTDFAKATLCLYKSVSPQEPYNACFVNAIEVDLQKCKKELVVHGAYKDVETTKAKQLECGTIPAQKYVLKVTYEGSYQKLGNAWAQADAYVKKHGLVRDYGYSPLERYIVTANNSEDENAITEIYIPLLHNGKEHFMK